jgi:hypothetical protein
MAGQHVQTEPQPFRPLEVWHPPTDDINSYWRLNNRSRMMREYHVRICEQLRGRFPGLTRLLVLDRMWGRTFCES